MTFKVTVVNKFSENVLHKGRNGAGVKAELFFIRFDNFNDFYKDILKEDAILPFVVVLIYIILRVTYIIISVRALEFED